MTAINAIRSVFAAARTPQSEGGTQVSAAELKKIVGAAYADDFVIDASESSEIAAQWAQSAPTDDGRAEYARLSKQFSLGGGLLGAAFNSLGIAAAPAHVLRDLPDGSYAIPTRFLGEQRTFSVAKQGNGATLQYNNTSYNIDEQGRFDIAIPGDWTKRFLKGTVTFDGAQLHVEADETTQHFDLTEHGGGGMNGQEVKKWSGIARLDGTSATPAPVSKTVPMTGSYKMVTTRAVEGPGRTDERALSGNVTLVTDNPNELYLVVPSELSPSTGQLKLTVDSGGHIAQAFSAGFGQTAFGTLKDGRLTLDIRTEGSTLNTFVTLTGGF